MVITRRDSNNLRSKTHVSNSSEFARALSDRRSNRFTCYLREDRLDVVLSTNMICENVTLKSLVDTMFSEITQYSLCSSNSILKFQIDGRNGEIGEINLRD